MAEQLIDEWQPIETAPRDQLILVRYRTDDPFVGELRGNASLSYGGASVRPCGIRSECGCSPEFEFVTLWHPLPLPPVMKD